MGRRVDDTSSRERSSRQNPDSVHLASERFGADRPEEMQMIVYVLLSGSIKLLVGRQVGRVMQGLYGPFVAHMVKLDWQVFMPELVS